MFLLCFLVCHTLPCLIITSSYYNNIQLYAVHTVNVLLLIRTVNIHLYINYCSCRFTWAYSAHSLYSIIYTHFHIILLVVTLSTRLTLFVLLSRRYYRFTRNYSLSLRSSLPNSNLPLALYYIITLIHIHTI